MGKKILYYHAGSGNHGCEALVKTLHFLLHADHLYSFNKEQDLKWGVDIPIIRQSHWGKTIDLDPKYNEGDLAISIGGDNYCDFGEQLVLYNDIFNATGCKTALIGCSIDEHMFNNESLIKDLRKFSLITARESITHGEIQKKGIEAHLVPDSAFILKTSKVSLQGDYVGINGSNKVDNEMTFNNYINMIQHILDNTKYKILLIPHVVQAYNNDLDFLQRLKNHFNNDRIEMLEECDCETLKGYISKCKMLICSRTHASIAGYSSCVPTLVVGYSTKSKGMAKDLFGDYTNYVIPYDSLTDTNQLKDAFIWLNYNKSTIKHDLEAIMPKYKKRCYDLVYLVTGLC